MTDFLHPSQIDAIAASYGTPCYIYSEKLVLESAQRFKNIPYEPKSIYAATMANNNPHLLRLMRKEGLKAFVNSLLHLEIIQSCGFQRSEVIYTATGISRSIMRQLVDRNIRLNIDSLTQLRLYGEMNPGGEIGLRLNITENTRGATFDNSESRIGICEYEFDDVLAVAKSCDLKIRGIHVYLGTDITDIEYLLHGTQVTLDLGLHFPDVEYVDLGGGFPVQGMNGVHFDFARYGEAIAKLFESYSQQRGRPIELVLEPGRSLFGDSAVFCTRVVDVKERPDRVIVGCDASLSIFPRPLFYEEYHRIRVNGKENGKPIDKRLDIVGNTTYSRDYLGKDVDIPAVDVEDLLVFEHSGSYCYAMITQFLGQYAPAEVLVTRDNEAILIRERAPVFVDSPIKSASEATMV